MHHFCHGCHHRWRDESVLSCCPWCGGAVTNMTDEDEADEFHAPIGFFVLREDVDAEE